MSIVLTLLLSTLSNIPSLEDTILINNWWSLGPFSVGVREGIPAVDNRIETDDFEPDTNAVYPSILAAGGSVKWEKITSDRGRIWSQYRNVSWDTLQDIYGNIGVLNAGYAWASFSSKGQRRGLVWAPNVSSFILNGRSYPGDAYADNCFPIPVVLKDGVNRVLLKFSGYGDHSAGFKISPATDPLMIIKPDVLLPDFVTSETEKAWLAVPVINTTEKRLYDIKIKLTGDLIKTTVSSVPDLIPLAGRKVPVVIEVKDNGAGMAAVDSTPVLIELSCGKFIRRDTCWVKIKKPQEVHSRTFLSAIDGSCQYYSVLPPREFQQDRSYGLLLSLHGASVEARNQAAAYTPKDWAFVVAPTNRRRYGFDWQDWGRLDALEVLAEAKKNFKIDEDRVCLVGHSMGGHGVWHIGLSHPDLFAALAPSAGWSMIQLYAPYTLQRSAVFAEPEKLKYRDMVLREDMTPVFLENALNLPVYILHGGSDDNVPPIQGRLMSHFLHDLNYEYVYDEVPGQGHWWNFDSTPGTDCIDKQEMMDYLHGKIRSASPKRVSFKTTDLAQSDRAYWLKVDELQSPYQEGFIEAEVQADTVKIKTRNIKRFSILAHNLPDLFPAGQTLFFRWNERVITHQIRPGANIPFYQKHDQIRIGYPATDGLTKTPALYGPIKRAYFTPFLLVYGTMGDSISTERNLHQARLQSYTWWMRANGFVEVVADTEVTEKMTEQFNLILFGNHQTNAYVKQINYKLPIHLEDGRVFAGEEKLAGDSLCFMEIYPNPHARDRFVLVYAAANQDMERFAGLFSTLYSSAGLPDFLVWDKSALNFGWAGVVAAGFFDSHWQLDKSLMFIKK